MMKKLIWFLFLVFLCGSAFGATYYADENGSGTTCSEGSPCTLSYAIGTKAAADGDIIYVNYGIHRMTYVTFQNDNIEIIGVPNSSGDLPIVTRLGLNTSWTQVGSTEEWYTAKSGGDPTADPVLVFEDGVMLRGKDDGDIEDIYGTPTASVPVAGSLSNGEWAEDDVNGRIYVRCSDGASPSTHAMETSNTTTLLFNLSGHDGIQISYLRIYGNTHPIVEGAGSTDNNIFNNEFVYNIYGVGPNGTGDTGWTINDNECWGIGWKCFQVKSTLSANILIDNNYIHNCPPHNLFARDVQSIMVENSSDVTISRQTDKDNGYDSDDYPGFTALFGILVDASTDVLIERLKSTGVRRNAVTFWNSNTFGELSDVTLREFEISNVSYTATPSASDFIDPVRIQIYEVDDPLYNVSILNGIIYNVDARTAGTDDAIIGIRTWSGAATMSDINIKNVSIVNCLADYGLWIYDLAGSEIDVEGRRINIYEGSIDFNGWFGNTFSTADVYNLGNTRTLGSAGTFCSSDLQGCNDVITDPMYMGDRYRLHPSSPHKDKGTPSGRGRWGDEVITLQNNRDFSSGTIGNWGKINDGTGTLTYDTTDIGGLDDKQALLTSQDDIWLYGYIDQARVTLTENAYHIFKADLYVDNANSLKDIDIRAKDFGLDETKTVTLPGGVWVEVNVRFYISSDVTGTFQIGFSGNPANGDLLYFDNVSIRPETYVYSSAVTDLNGRAITDASGGFLTDSGMGTAIDMGAYEAFYPVVSQYPQQESIVEDETGYENIYVSAVDGQAWIGGHIPTALPNNVTAITKANPGVVSSVAHGLSVDDLVYFDSLTEMTELNETIQKVTAVGSADLFSINDTSGYTTAESTGGACGHSVVSLSQYADTNNTIVAIDDSGNRMLGFAGPAGTGETLGSELVTNGDFATDITGWNNYESLLTTLEWSSGKLHAVSGGVVWSSVRTDENISVVAGKRYELSYDYAVSTGTLRRASLGFDEGAFFVKENFNGSGTFIDQATLDTTDDSMVFNVTLAPSQGICDFTIDNVSLKEVTEPNEAAIHVLKTRDGTEGWGTIDDDMDFDNITKFYVKERVPTDPAHYVMYSLDPSVVVNGTMEDVGSWTIQGTPTTHERSSTYAYEQTYSRKITGDADDEGERQVVTVENGETYVVSGFIRDSNGNASIEADSTLLLTSATIGEWEYVKGEIVATSTSMNIDLFSGVGAAYFDVIKVEKKSESELSHFAGCEICSTPDNGDELDEGFLGTGYENTWTETIGATGVVDEDFILSGDPPDRCCIEGLNTSVTTSGGITYTVWDKGSTIAAATDIDIVIELYIDSYTLPDPGDTIRILNWDDDAVISDTGGAVLTIANDGGTLSIRAQGATDSSYVALAIDTWYTITIHQDATAADSYFKVDDGADQTFTRNAGDCRYLRIGPSHGVASYEAIDLEWGYIYVNTP